MIRAIFTCHYIKMIKLLIIKIKQYQFILVI